jgi:polyisoprenoid-binding protein YceI
MSRLSLLGLATVLVATVSLVVIAQPDTNNGHDAAADQSEAAPMYQVDPVHSSIVFRVGHLGIGYVYGRFNQYSGTFHAEGADTLSRIEFEVEASSIDTGHERRDNHLRSDDFFDAEQYPKISFRSTDVQRDAQGLYHVNGELTMLGQTRPAHVMIEAVGAGEDQRGNVRAGFATTFTVNRSDFGMEWGVANNMVSDEVKLYVAFEGIRQ